MLSPMFEETVVACWVVTLVACAPAPAFQAGTADSDAAPTEVSEPDVVTSSEGLDGSGAETAEIEVTEDPCAACVPGERCVDGSCVSCADACTPLLSGGMCGDDGCGGVCGCSTLGPCTGGACLCGDSDCVAIVANFGARSIGVAFDRRDSPVFVVGTGDDIALRRAGSVVRWSGEDFVYEEVDEMKPTSDGGSIVVTPEGRVHAVFAGTELSQGVPRHIVQDGAAGGWRAANVGSEPCVDAKLGLYNSQVILGCFDKTTSSAVFRAWADDASRWSSLTTSTAIAGSPDVNRWPDEWDWTVDPKSGEIVVAYVRRSAPTAVVAIKTFTPGGAWIDKDLDDLVNTDPEFVHRISVVRDGFSKTRVVVRDKASLRDGDTRVLRQLLETKDGSTPTIAWQSDALDGGLVFACAPLPGAGLDIAVRKGFTVQYLGWTGDGASASWGDPVELDLEQDVANELAMAVDASGQRHVAVLADWTVVRLWAPTGTPPR